jgi:hypothetical protein
LDGQVSQEEDSEDILKMEAEVRALERECNLLEKEERPAQKKRE